MTRFATDPKRCGGYPCVVTAQGGRWIPVWLISDLAKLQAEDPIQSVISAYSILDPAEVVDALRYHELLTSAYKRGSQRKSTAQVRL